MSSKKKQRTKGNVKPSSSAKAAELLTSTGQGFSSTVGFVGFDTFSVSEDGGGSIGEPKSLDPDIRVAFRQTFKRDSVTKLKALRSIEKLFDEKDDKSLLVAAECWPRLYNRLALDGDFRIREATHRGLRILVGRLRKQFEPQLRNLFPTWSMGFHDPYPSTASAALDAFDEVFSTAKAPEVFNVCKSEILTTVVNIIIKQTSPGAAASDGNSAAGAACDGEESPEERQLRLSACALACLENCLFELPESALAESEFVNRLCEELLDKPKFWKSYPVSSSVSVKKPFFTLLKTLLDRLPSSMKAHQKKIMLALLSSVNDSNPAVCNRVCNSMLALLSVSDGIWDEVSIEKAFLPKICPVLAKGCAGCAQIIGPCCLPIASKLPFNDTEIMKKFIDAVSEGCKTLLRQPNCPTEELVCQLLAFSDCIRYVISRGKKDGSTVIDVEYLTDQFSSILVLLMNQRPDRQPGTFLVMIELLVFIINKSEDDARRFTDAMRQAIALTLLERRGVGVRNIGELLDNLLSQGKTLRSSSDSGAKNSDVIDSVCSELAEYVLEEVTNLHHEERVAVVTSAADSECLRFLDYLARFFPERVAEIAQRRPTIPAAWKSWLTNFDSTKTSFKNARCLIAIMVWGVLGQPSLSNKEKMKSLADLLVQVKSCFLLRAAFVVEGLQGLNARSGDDAPIKGLADLPEFTRAVVDVIISAVNDPDTREQTGTDAFADAWHALKHSLCLIFVVPLAVAVELTNFVESSLRESLRGAVGVSSITDEEYAESKTNLDKLDVLIELSLAFFTLFALTDTHQRARHAIFLAFFDVYVSALGVSPKLPSATLDRMKENWPIVVHRFLKKNQESERSAAAVCDKDADLCPFTAMGSQLKKKLFGMDDLSGQDVLGCYLPVIESLFGVSEFREGSSMNLLLLALIPLEADWERLLQAVDLSGYYEELQIERRDVLCLDHGVGGGEVTRDTESAGTALLHWALVISELLKLAERLSILDRVADQMIGAISMVHVASAFASVEKNRGLSSSENGHQVSLASLMESLELYYDRCINPDGEVPDDDGDASHSKDESEGSSPAMFRWILERSKTGGKLWTFALRICLDFVRRRYGQLTQAINPELEIRNLLEELFSSIDAAMDGDKQGRLESLFQTVQVMLTFCPPEMEISSLIMEAAAVAQGNRGNDEPDGAGSTETASSNPDVTVHQVASDSADVDKVLDCKDMLRLRLLLVLGSIIAELECKHFVLDEWFRLTRGDKSPIPDDVLLLTSNLSGKSCSQISMNINLIDFLTSSVKLLPTIDDEKRDFFLCSMLAFLQTVNDSELAMPIELTLASRAVSLFNDVAEMMNGLSDGDPVGEISPSAVNGDGSVKPIGGASLVTEWNEFFMQGSLDLLMRIFVTFLSKHGGPKQPAGSENQDDISMRIFTNCISRSLLFVEKDDIDRCECLPLLLSPDLDCLGYEQSLQTQLLHFLPLLCSHNWSLQLASYHLLSRLLPNVIGYETSPKSDLAQRGPGPSEGSTKDKNSSDEERFELELPSYLASSLKQSYVKAEATITTAHSWDALQGDEEELTKLLSYLLCWKLILGYLSKLDFENRAKYGAALQKDNRLENLMLTLFFILPENPLVNGRTAGDVTGSCFNWTRPLDKKASSEGKQAAQSPEEVFTGSSDGWPKDRRMLSCHFIERLSCQLYYDTLKTCPALIRQWWNNQSKRTSVMIDRFTEKFVSPLLCSEELKLVSQADLSDWINLNIQVRPTIRELIATYSMEDLSMELIVRLPANHPLGAVVVDSSRRVGVSKEQWRKWMLQLNIVLMHQNGSLLEALRVWKRNIDQHMAGVEDCMICMMTVHGSNYSLPKITCKQCKKRFHSSCLYKWFNTSSNTSCPMCRVQF